VPVQVPDQADRVVDVPVAAQRHGDPHAPEERAEALLLKQEKALFIGNLRRQAARQSPIENREDIETPQIQFFIANVGR
jgi:hypothetical protein